jgi:hypothetical protein
MPKALYSNRRAVLDTLTEVQNSCEQVDRPANWGEILGIRIETEFAKRVRPMGRPDDTESPNQHWEVINLPRACTEYQLINWFWNGSWEISVIALRPDVQSKIGVARSRGPQPTRRLVIGASRLLETKPEESNDDEEAAGAH